jgi:demethylmenaquinone methyltransferase / 2-methoxy-6-polyprenyl-1,4-benzoquinol methylase
MSDKDSTAVHMNHQVLAATPHPDHPASRQQGREIRRQGAPKIAAPNHHPHQHAPLEDGNEGAADGLDFGQLGHDATIVAWTVGISYLHRMSRKHDTVATDEADGDTTHFGFRAVSEVDKASLVREVFDSVAPRYDLMNDLMSLGVHRLWKRAFLDALNPRPGMRLLDVGGGTGDIAFRFLGRGGGQALVCDINTEMLDVGRDRAIDANILDGIAWLCGDAEHLPVAQGSVDAYTIAFCIRNVTRIPSALAEARRVLAPGGRFLCLEFSEVVVPVLDRLYDLYSFQVLPVLGELVARDREAYQYLVESIRRFPPQDAFAAMIEDAGLEQASYRNLSGGIAAIHSAWRI